MRTIIAGSRTIGERATKWLVTQIVQQKNLIVTEVVSGTARGVDKGGELYASANKIPVKQFPANWDKHGKSAGYIRNKEMAQHGEQVIILWDGVSKGTNHMVELAKESGLHITLFDLSK